MADTVDLTNLTETEEASEEVETKALALARLINQSKHVVFYTGAGISTSANIPDFRGPDGVWTRKAQGRAPPKGVAMTQAVPTFCHMALAQLLEDKTAKYIVSQNVDGLHRRSGVPAELLSELHGNMYLETCWACHSEYLRTYDVAEGGGRGYGSCKTCLQRVPHFCHCTKRVCKCGQLLKDSIIHFKENLPEAALTRAFEEGARADLCIVLGSSCTVSPACEVPRMTVKKGGKLVIVNMQKTPLDKLASLRIFAKTDLIMQLVMAHLRKKVVPFEESRACQQERQRLMEECAQTKTRKWGIQPQHAPGAVERADEAMADVGGAVSPKKDCPHATEGIAPAVLTTTEVTQLMEAGCEECGDKRENWFCALCRRVLCSRYVRGHMKAHAQGDHVLATSLQDLSTWCFTCDSYIECEASQKNYVALHQTVFGTPPASRPVDARVSPALVAPTAEEDRGGYVVPITNCPHLEEGMHKDPMSFGVAQELLDAGCTDCGDKSENWFCVLCRRVFCSRYVHGHMKTHNAATHHPIATSLRDFNTWCYQCDGYLAHPSLKHAGECLEMLKHGLARVKKPKKALPTVQEED